MRFLFDASKRQQYTLEDGGVFMKKVISLILCLAMALSCLGCGLFTVSAATATAVMYNGFNTNDEFSRSGILSLCGNGTKRLDTAQKAEGASSLYIDMPATLDSMVGNFAYYTDLESATYYTLADYDYLEILYKSDVTLTGNYKMQVRLVDKAVSVAGGGYEYEVSALLDQNWNKAVFDLSAPYYTLEGMQGKFNRIRFVMLNATGSYKEIDTHIDGVLLYTEAYKTARDNALTAVAQKTDALPQPTQDNLDEVKPLLDEITALLADGSKDYQNFVPDNFSSYLTKKEVYDQLKLGIDPTKTETMLFNGFDSTADLNKTGILSLAGSSTKSIDSTVKFAGNGSLRIDMAATNDSYLKPYAYYFDIDHDYIDYTKYDYVEAMMKTDSVETAGYHMQLHLIDTAVSTKGSGYDYDSALSLDTTWRRFSQPLSSPYYSLDGMGNNINRIRFILLSYADTYQQVDMNVDTLFLCNKAYADARSKAEQTVAALIADLPAVTESNYQFLASQFEAIDAAITQGNEDYVNFYPANYAGYAAKKALFDAYVSGEGITVNFSMPNFFSDNMLFQQNKEINLFGNATTGNTITASLYAGSASQPIDTASATADNKGKWTVSLKPRKGDYTAYRLVISENGQTKKTLSNVVIGELWLAAGQSNMEYRLDWEKTGAEEIANANDSYLRVLHMNGNPVGTNPVEPARYDIAGANWVDGAKGSNIASMSANGYYAAKVMREKLDVPVAIINAALGSTNIQTWLSRESIEANDVVKSALQKANQYKTQQQSATEAGDYRHITAVFNTKVAPLAGLNVGGVFWCQGESNSDGKPNETGFYRQAIQALASGYSNIFGYENGDMPVIVINIANHVYLGDSQCIPKWIEEIDAAAKANSNIINIPIYDVPLTYVNPPSPSVAYAIHPNTKKPGGTRAGLAAAHNFCGYGDANYYAPTVASYEVKNHAIYVTFNDVADGLRLLDNSIGVHGFTIADQSNNFIPAKATIVGKNVVKIWHDDITEPTNFTYAFNSHAQTANLCNSYSLPAVPYRSDKNMKNFFASNDWMYCDDISVFVNHGATGDYETTWQGGLSGDVYALASVDKTVRHEGTGSIKIAYETDKKVTTGATVFFGNYLMPISLQKYQTISVMIRNDDARDKTLRLLVGEQDGESMWMLPLSSTDESLVYQTTIQANSDFTCYTFSLRKAVGYNTDASVPLTRVNRIDLLIEDTQSGTLYIDDVTVGTLSATQKVERDAAAAQAVIDQIDGLPQEITNDAREQVIAVRAAYEGLTDTQKGLVTNLQKLLDAEAALNIVQPEKITYGDVDGDDKVPPADALEVLKSVVGKVTLTEEQSTAADTDGSGKADAADALNILKKVVGKIDLFPVEE